MYFFPSHFIVQLGKASESSENVYQSEEILLSSVKQWMKYKTVLYVHNKYSGGCDLIREQLASKGDDTGKVVWLHIGDIQVEEMMLEMEIVA